MMENMSDIETKSGEETFDDMNDESLNIKLKEMNEALERISSKVDECYLIYLTYRRALIKAISFKVCDTTCTHNDLCITKSPEECFIILIDESKKEVEKEELLSRTDIIPK